MKKYVVTLEETVHYHLYIDAEDEDSAGDMATDQWNDSINPDTDFDCYGFGVEVIGTEAKE